MSNPALATVIHNLRRLAESHGDRHESDKQLLERFLADRDEAAFTALVRRHGRLVLSACRRVLNEEADVEDAFQATFLVLLRRAPLIRWQASVGNWLFGVAHRIAVQARVHALRRRRREEEARSHCPELQSPPDLSWREAVGLLHEELDRLPDAYRLPLLFCCLDGKTRDEAARALGCSVGAIRGRLERGREMLRRRLIRRGLTLSGTLLAVLVDAPSATSALSPQLVQATLRAAVTDAYPGPIAVLIQAVHPTVFTGKLRIAVGLLLTITLLAVGGSVHLLTPRAAIPATEPSTASPNRSAQNPPAAKPADSSVTLRGRVVGPDGKPVKGARLYSPHLRKDPPDADDDFTIAHRGVTDADGRFRVTLPRADLRFDWDASLVAAADGYGVDWVKLPKGDSATELTLRLVKDQAIQGRLLSTEGRPLAGVRVSVAALLMAPGGRLDDFLTAWEKDWQSAQRRAPKQVETPTDLMMSIVTDKDGRFRIPGIGSERVAQLQLRGAGVAQAFLYVITRPGFDPKALNKASHERMAAQQRTFDEPPPLYGPRFEHVAAPARIIEGTVREAGSGKLVAGYTVSASAGYNNPVWAVSDKQGHYRLVGLPKTKEYLLTAEPPEKSSWLRAGARVADTEGLQPLQVNFTVARGIVVTGRVIDRTTGKGVQSGMHFAPLPDNKHFGKPGYDSYRYERLNTATDAEGHFRIVVLPGPVVLMAQAWAGATTSDGQAVNPYQQAEFDAEDRKHVPVTIRDDDRYFTAADNSLEFLDIHNVVKRLDLAPDAGAVACDLYLRRGRTQTVKIQDAQGKPLTGAAVAGMSATGGSIVRSLRDATCTVFALDPKKPRRMIFLHLERRLGSTLTVRDNEKEPPTARLERTGTVIGRLLDLDGQPIAGVEIDLAFEDGDARELYRRLDSVRPPVYTDKDGRFRLEGVVPGLQLGLSLRKGRAYLAGEPRIGLRQVKPGETLDLDDRRTKPQR